MLRIRDVLASENGITLIAGENGIHAPISRTHMVENVEIASMFISNNEMIFTTGAGLKEEAELYQFVKAAWESGASGVVINIGPYIRSIAPSIIDFAQDKNLPLFSCPWEVRMAEIMHRVSWMIKENEHKEITEAMALKEVIQHPEDWPMLRKFGFHEGSRFYVGITKKAHTPPQTAFSFEVDGYHTVVFVDCSKEDLNRLWKSGFMAVSDLCDMTTLHRGFYKAQKLFHLFRSDVGIRFLDESGIYQLLLNIEDKQLLERYRSTAIGKLTKYDTKKKSDLLTVLDTYLRCGSSLKEASDILGIHKNTVTNKVHKCEEVLGVDLSKPMVKLGIQSAIMIQDILEIPD